MFERNSPVSQFLGTKLDQHSLNMRADDIIYSGAVLPTARFEFREGYRWDTVVRPETCCRGPALVVQTPHSQVVDVFRDLIRAAFSSGSTSHLDVVLIDSEQARYIESNCDGISRGEVSLHGLFSLLAEYQDTITQDGFISLFVGCEEPLSGIQLDEHKIIQVFGNCEQSSIAVLENWNIPHNSELRLIYEVEHAHTFTNRRERENLRFKISA